MNTLFEFVVDTDGIALTILGFSRFTLFAFVLARRPKKMFGLTLFNMQMGIVEDS